MSGGLLVKNSVENIFIRLFSLVVYIGFSSVSASLNFVGYRAKNCSAVKMTVFNLFVVTNDRSGYLRASRSSLLKYLSLPTRHLMSVAQ